LPKGSALWDPVKPEQRVRVKPQMCVRVKPERWVRVEPEWCVRVKQQMCVLLTRECEVDFDWLAQCVDLISCDVTTIPFAGLI